MTALNSSTPDMCTQRLFNSINFAVLAALAKSCALLCSTLVFIQAIEPLLRIRTTRSVYV